MSYGGYRWVILALSYVWMLGFAFVFQSLPPTGWSIVCSSLHILLSIKNSKPENLGLGFGIISTCMGVGITFGPYLTGLFRDITGS